MSSAMLETLARAEKCAAYGFGYAPGTKGQGRADSDRLRALAKWIETDGAALVDQFNKYPGFLMYEIEGGFLERLAGVLTEESHE